MIKKDKLIKGLQELIYYEEGMVTLYVNFSKVLLKRIKDIDEDKRTEIEESLFQLYQDSSRHRELLQGLTKEIRSSHRNEY